MFIVIVRPFFLNIWPKSNEHKIQGGGDFLRNFPSSFVSDLICNNFPFSFHNFPFSSHNFPFSFVSDLICQPHEEKWWRRNIRSAAKWGRYVYWGNYLFIRNNLPGHVFVYRGELFFLQNYQKTRTQEPIILLTLWGLPKTCPKEAILGKLVCVIQKYDALWWQWLVCPGSIFSILPNLYFCNFVFLGQSLTCVPRQAKQSLSNSDIPFTFVLLSASTSRSIHDLKNKQILFVFAKMKYVNTNFQANHFSYLF